MKWLYPNIYSVSWYNVGYEDMYNCNGQIFTLSADTMWAMKICNCSGKNLSLLSDSEYDIMIIWKTMNVKL
jgi:hypothetical protein